MTAQEKLEMFKRRNSEASRSGEGWEGDIGNKKFYAQGDDYSVKENIQTTSTFYRLSSLTKGNPDAFFQLVDLAENSPKEFANIIKTVYPDVDPKSLVHELNRPATKQEVREIGMRVWRAGQQEGFDVGKEGDVANAGFFPSLLQGMSGFTEGAWYGGKGLIDKITGSTPDVERMYNSGLSGGWQAGAEQYGNFGSNTGRDVGSLIAMLALAKVGKLPSAVPAFGFPVVSQFSNPETTIPEALLKGGVQGLSNYAAMTLPGKFTQGSSLLKQLAVDTGIDALASVPNALINGIPTDAEGNAKIGEYFLRNALTNALGFGIGKGFNQVQINKTLSDGNKLIKDQTKLMPVEGKYTDTDKQTLKRIEKWKQNATQVILNKENSNKDVQKVLEQSTKMFPFDEQGNPIVKAFMEKYQEGYWGKRNAEGRNEGRLGSTFDSLERLGLREQNPIPERLGLSDAELIGLPQDSFSRTSPMLDALLRNQASGRIADSERIQSEAAARAALEQQDALRAAQEQEAADKMRMEEESNQMWIDDEADNAVRRALSGGHQELVGLEPGRGNESQNIKTLLDTLETNGLQTTAREVAKTYSAGKDKNRATAYAKAFDVAVKALDKAVDVSNKPQKNAVAQAIEPQKQVVTPPVLPETKKASTTAVTKDATVTPPPKTSTRKAKTEQSSTQDTTTKDTTADARKEGTATEEKPQAEKKRKAAARPETKPETDKTETTKDVKPEPPPKTEKTSQEKDSSEGEQKKTVAKKADKAKAQSKRKKTKEQSSENDEHSNGDASDNNVILDKYGNPMDVDAVRAEIAEKKRKNRAEEGQEFGPEKEDGQDLEPAQTPSGAVKKHIDKILDAAGVKDDTVRDIIYDAMWIYEHSSEGSLGNMKFPSVLIDKDGNTIDADVLRKNIKGLMGKESDPVLINALTRAYARAMQRGVNEKIIESAKKIGRRFNQRTKQDIDLIIAGDMADIGAAHVMIATDIKTKSARKLISILAKLRVRQEEAGIKLPDDMKDEDKDWMVLDNFRNEVKAIHNEKNGNTRRRLISSFNKKYGDLKISQSLSDNTMKDKIKTPQGRVAILSYVDDIVRNNASHRDALKRDEAIAKINDLGEQMEKPLEIINNFNWDGVYTKEQYDEANEAGKKLDALEKEMNDAIAKGGDEANKILRDAFDTMIRQKKTSSYGKFEVDQDGKTTWVVTTNKQTGYRIPNKFLAEIVLGSKTQKTGNDDLRKDVRDKAAEVLAERLIGVAKKSQSRLRNVIAGTLRKVAYENVKALGLDKVLEHFHIEKRDLPNILDRDMKITKNFVSEFKKEFGEDGYQAYLRARSIYAISGNTKILDSIALPNKDTGVLKENTLLLDVISKLPELELTRDVGLDVAAKVLSDDSNIRYKLSDADQDAIIKAFNDEAKESFAEINKVLNDEEDAKFKEDSEIESEFEKKVAAIEERVDADRRRLIAIGDEIAEAGKTDDVNTIEKLIEERRKLEKQVYEDSESIENMKQDFSVSKKDFIKTSEIEKIRDNTVVAVDKAVKHTETDQDTVKDAFSTLLNGFEDHYLITNRYLGFNLTDIKTQGEVQNVIKNISLEKTTLDDKHKKYIKNVVSDLIYNEVVKAMVLKEMSEVMIKTKRLNTIIATCK